MIRGPKKKKGRPRQLSFTRPLAAQTGGAFPRRATGFQPVSYTHLIYRARDEARKLTDEEFARVRKFVETAFDMALEFNREAKAANEPKAPDRRKPAERKVGG